MNHNAAYTLHITIPTSAEISHAAKLPLSISQRALMAARLVQLTDPSSFFHIKGTRKISYQEASAQLNVSKEIFDYAMTLFSKGSPQQIQAVADGHIDLMFFIENPYFIAGEDPADLRRRILRFQRRRRKKLLRDKAGVEALKAKYAAKT